MASPKRSYKPTQQKQYYQEAAKLFDNLTEAQKDKVSDLSIAASSRPIEEWFKLFLQIVDNEQMLGELRRNLKAVLLEEEVREGAISTNLPERHTRRV